jgi:hypothetical protein
MITPVQTAIGLVTGLALGALFAGIAGALSRYTRRILVTALIIATLPYVLFSIHAREIPFWLLVKLTGALIYSSIGLLGLHGSSWWLVAGWALHPLWDMVLHNFGPGSSFAPSWYTIPCVSFDLVVAGYVASLRTHVQL